MAKAVFTTKAQSAYDDLPEVRYHFPRTYLRQVEQALGDLIVYYQPRREDSRLSSHGGRQSYFAVARLVSITVDSIRPEHFYGNVEDYLEFDNPVPFRAGPEFLESGLRKSDGTTNRGAFRRAVRVIRDHEFDAILRAGFTKTSDQDKAYAGSGLFDEPATDAMPWREQVISRPFRDAAFSRKVQEAYKLRCAITGLKIINGGGRPEAEAAHIRPVAHSGPDSIRNGIALSRTVHWMFDRGLLSVSDDYQILVADRTLPEHTNKLINSARRLLLPENQADWPHRQFLTYHRQNVFLG